MSVDSGIITCPDCSAPHSMSMGNVCVICGYNFTTGAHAEIPYPSDNRNQLETNLFSQLTEESTIDLNGNENYPFFGTWELVVIIDPALGHRESPSPPAGQPPLVFRLAKEVNLIGRYSQKKGVEPEISLNFDDAISHRHAQIIFQPDGTLFLRDLGSANGTKLNEVKIPAMDAFQLKDGDQIILGHWTKMIIRQR